MAENDSYYGSLIAESGQIKAKAEARKRSEAAARSMVPGLKLELGSLLLARVPAPDIIPVQVPLGEVLKDSRYLDSGISTPGELIFPTKLFATVPHEGGLTTVVTVGASGYPDLDNPDSAKDLNYKIELDGLDRLMVISGGEAKIQSTEMVSYGSDHRIGTPNPIRPLWWRYADEDDIAQHQELLDDLDDSHVIFNASKPPPIRRPSSKVVLPDSDHGEFGVPIDEPGTET